MGKLKQKFLFLLWMKNYLKYYIQRTRNIGFANKLSMFFNGFFETSYILYNLKENNRKDYISDFKDIVTLQLINKHNVVLENKIFFADIVKQYASVSEVAGYFFNGYYYPVTDKSVNDFQAAVKKYNSLILKQIDGDGGLGIFRVDFINEEYYINNKKVTEADVISLSKSLTSYFASQIIKQTGYANAIYPRTVNTVRFLTFIDVATNKPFIAAAAHRIGNSKSFPVDNCAKGGYTAQINLETGVMSKAVSTKVDKEMVWYTHHPDSGAAIEGVKIPYWDSIKERILALASLFPYLVCIGWDVIIQEDGAICLLEGNNGPDIKLHQVHAPLLADKRVKDFLSYHK